MAVVGSGMAGLVTATGLRESNVDVTLFEKSRGPGGRMAAKRLPAPAEGSADIGAQYFTVRNKEFRRFLQRHVGDSGWGEWRGRFRYQDKENRWQDMHGAQRYVGIPRMSAITRAIARNLDVRSGVRIARLERTDSERWTLEDTQGLRYGDFDAIILTPPPAQTVALLDDSGLARLAESPDIQANRLQACWTLVVHFPEGTGARFQGFRPNSYRLHWAANNSSKPGREDSGEWWVLHGDPDWSDRNTGMDPQQVTAELLEEFFQCSGITATPGQTLVHRWLYAMPRSRTAPGHLWFDEQGVGIAGDWMDGGRVEGAFNSATSLLRHLAASGWIHPPETPE